MRLYDDGPRIVILEMTRACALACQHCRAEAIPHHDPRELTTKEAFGLIDEVAAWGKAIFVLTGGDPLMRPDIYEIVEYAVGRSLRVAVSPSATGRLTQRALTRLSDAGCKRISLSLDGADAATHDAFRGVRGVFDRTLKAALGALDAGMELQVNTTIARHNYRSIGEMARLLPQLGAVLWSAFFLVPTGRAQRNQCLSAEECEAAFAELYETWLSAPFDVKTTEAPHYRRYVLQRLEALTPGKALRKGGPPALRFPAIGDGKGFVFVSHVGEIQPSGFLPFTAGNVRAAPLLDVYRDSPIMRGLRDSDGFGGKCGRCDFRMICGGSRARAYAMTGDPCAADLSCSYVAPADAEVRTPS
jgi:radical SAM protein